MSSAPATTTTAESGQLTLPTLPPIPTNLPKTSHEEQNISPTERNETGEDEQVAKEDGEDPDASKLQAAIKTDSHEEPTESIEETSTSQSAKPALVETLGDINLADAYQGGDTNALAGISVPKDTANTTDDLNVHDPSNAGSQAKTEETQADYAQGGNNDDSIPDENAATARPKKTSKKRPPGRPRGSRSKRRAVPRCSSSEDPSKDFSRIPKTARYLKKIETKNPALAIAYTELEAAKQERDMVAQYVDEVQEEADNLQAKLKKIHERLEQAKIRLETEEETVKRCADAVGEAELQVDCSWNTNFQKLAAYKEKHGHVRLPTRCPEDKELDSLCIWVAHQKARYQLYITGEVKTKKPHRIAALESLGIAWVVKGSMWRQKYNELLAFKERHGHCMVPTRTSKEYKDLGTWVGVQRTEYKNLKDGKQSQLTLERIELLNKTGFVWNVTDLKWQEMYEKLVKYRAEQGHCSVPERYPPDQPLSNWVVRQRKEYQLLCDENVNNEVDEKGRTRRMRMTQERLKLLNDIGFEW